MSEDRQIDAISIGIGANLAGLKQQLAEAQREVSGFSFRPPKQAEIPFTVRINSAAAETKLAKLVAAEREVKIRAVLIPTQTSMKEFRQLMRDQIAKGNEFVIPFKADLKSARAIKQSIQEAITGAGPVVVQMAWQWGPGGPPPSGGGGPESAPGGRPRKPPKSPVSGGGGATTVVTPTQPPQEPVHQAPRIVTRPPRPVTAKATGPVTVGPEPSPIYPGLAKTAYARPGGGTVTGNVELSPGVGAARAQGVSPGLNQRLKRAVARTMRTGDPSDIYSILGPFQELTQSLGKYEGYNLPGAGGGQVNLRQLIDEALGFAQTRRRPDQGPLREFEEFVPKEAKFRPETLQQAARLGDFNYDFVQRAQGRAVSTGGVYSDIDVHVADQRRRLVNRIRQQLHAEDPKAFKAAFDTRRGSVNRLKDMGLMALANLTASSAGLKKIAPATPEFLEDLAGSERQNKALESALRHAEVTRKRALAPDREQQTVVSSKTGKKRTISSRGLPFVQSTGVSDVQSFINLLDQQQADAAWAKNFKGRAGGGELGPLQRRILERQGKLPPPKEAPVEPARPIEPFEPAWRRRAREGKGFIKDLTEYALGGRPWGKSGAYTVGEQGKEIFVPESAGWIIPHRLMDQLPKRADGGGVLPPRPEEPGPDESDAQRRERMARDVGAFRAWQQEQGVRLTRKASRAAYHAYSGPYEGDVQALPGDPGQARLRVPKGQPGGGRFLPGDPLKAFAAGANALRVTVVSPSGGNAPTSPVTATAGGPLRISDLPAELRAEAMSQLPETGPLPGLTRSQAVEARISARYADRAARMEDAMRRAGVRADIMQAAVRAAGPQMGETVGTIAGRGGILARKASVDIIEQDINFVIGQARDIQEDKLKLLQKMANAAATGKDFDYDAANTELDGLDEAATTAARSLSKFREEASVVSPQVATLGDKVKVTAANMVGIAAGSMLYAGVFTAIQAGLSVASAVLSPLVDKASDYLLTTVQVTGALKDQTKAQNMNAQAAVSGTIAMTGLSGASAEAAKSALMPRAFGEAANQTLVEQLSMVRTGQRVGQENIGPFDRSTFFGTGGLAQIGNVNIGGTPSTFEVALNSLRPLANMPTPIEAGFEGAMRSNILAGPFYNALNPIGNTQNQQYAQAALTAMNDNLVKSGSKYQFVQNASAEEIAQATGAAADMAVEFPELGEQAGQLATLFQGAGMVIKDASGQVVTSGEALAQVFDDLKKAATPTAAGLVDQMKRQREIAQFQITQQTRRQLDFSLPAQAAMQFYGNRPLAPGVGVVPPPGAQGYGGFTPADAYTQQSFGRFRDRAQQAFDNVSQYAAQGLTKLYDAGVPPDLINKYTSLGESIRDIQTDLANRQAVQSAVQYNHQLFITNRALSDARGLHGDIGDTSGHNLGVLERENWLLGRQSQQLSFILTQRQINFSIAKAGFQAPGLTAEERAANIAEAKYEASFAQKQLDISKKQFVIGGQIFDETTMRQVNDLRFALADLKAGHAIEIDSKNAQATIALIQADMANTANLIGVHLGKAEQIFAATISEAATIAATATGEAFNVILTGVSDAWAAFGAGAQGAYDSITGTPNLTDNGFDLNRKDRLETPQYALPPGRRGDAAGALFNTSGTMSMIVGEAGTETVAVLRAPRNVGYTPSGGGGNSFNFVVTINGNADSDSAHTLAREVVRLVEAEIDMRASLIMRTG